jgi:hypothetical protein
MAQPGGRGRGLAGRVRPQNARRSARDAGKAERAVSLETDPTLQGYVIARITLGAVFSGLGRHAQAAPVLTEAWERSGQVEVPAFIGLQAAGLLAMCLLETGREDEARRLVHQVSTAVQACWTRSVMRPLQPSLS